MKRKVIVSVNGSMKVRITAEIDTNGLLSIGEADAVRDRIADELMELVSSKVPYYGCPLNKVKVS